MHSLLEDGEAASSARKPAEREQVRPGRAESSGPRQQGLQALRARSGQTGAGGVAPECRKAHRVHLQGAEELHRRTGEHVGCHRLVVYSLLLTYYPFPLSISFHLIQGEGHAEASGIRGQVPTAVSGGGGHAVNKAFTPAYI